MSIDALVNPRSIAVVGASENHPGLRSYFASLERMGFDGPIYPINPKYSTLLGRPCYPSLRDLPAAPDTVAFRVGYQRVLDNFRMLPDCGAKSAVIYDGGFAEAGNEGRRLQSEIAGIAREAGIALCGPNCMGILNPHGRTGTYMQQVNDLDALTGNVGLVSHSGGICISMVNDIRRYGFSLVVSAGNEAVTSAASFIDWMVDDPNTKIIAGFLESVREPDEFVAALDRAAAEGKPVVVVKVGRSERTRRAIFSHTAGIAEEPRGFSELLKAHHAIEVADLDEMAEVLTVLQGPRWPSGPKTSILLGSGGMAELLLDVSAEAGLDLPPSSSEVRQSAESVIGPIGGDANPMDVWGHGEYDRNLAHAYQLLDDDPNTDAIVECIDAFDFNPMIYLDSPLDTVRMIAGAAQKSTKPHYVLSLRSGVFHREHVDYLSGQGVMVLSGIREGLGAIEKVAGWVGRNR